MKNKLAKLYKSKKINILIAFTLLALLFSLLTKLSKDYTRTISFNIEKLNVPDEYVVINDSLQKIDVTISTYGFNLLKYYFIKPKLKVDFSKLKKTSTYFLWTKSNEFQNIANQFNSNIKINGIKPDIINFKYDAYFVKSVPVVLNKNIAFATGFDIDGNYQIKPDSIKVIGAKKNIDSITNIETKPLVLNNINSDIKSTIKLNIPKDKADIKYSSDEVNILGTVKKFTEGSFLVPVFVTNLPENIRIKYFPKEIEVTFYTSLDYFKTISANNFRVECDFKIITDDNDKLIPKVVKQPDSVRNVRLGTKSIEFIKLK